MKDFVKWFPVYVFVTCTMALLFKENYESAWYCGCATWFAIESRLGLVNN